MFCTHEDKIIIMITNLDAIKKTLFLGSEIKLI